MTSYPRKADKSGKLTPQQLRRKIALLEAGLSIADVARKAGVSRQTAWEVLMDKCASQRVQEAYAHATGKALDFLFPSRAA